MQPVDKRLDIAIALLLIAICAVFLWEARDLPPGTFEPLGSAPVPRATAGLVIFLCLTVIVQAALRPGDGSARVEVAGYLDAALLVVLTLAYVAAIHLRLSTFAILTSIYLIATIGWLVRFRPRLLPAVGITAVVVGFGCQYVFTRIFIVDLPGL